MKKSSRIFYSATGIIALFIILLFINIAFSRINIRFDTTSEKLYSLSKNTKDILSSLEDDVIIKVFYSKNIISIPMGIKNYAKSILLNILRARYSRP